MPPQIPTSTNATMALVLVGVFGMEVEQDAKIRPLLPNMVLHGLHGNARYSGEILYMNWPHSKKTEKLVALSRCAL